MKSPSNSLFLIGLNHQTAPLTVREKVTFEPAALPNIFSSLKERAGVSEAIVLATCNRTEIYAYSGDSRAVLDWVAKDRGLSLDTLCSHIYYESNQSVLQHAARVASGMDSMVLGETQILGQMKAAYQNAEMSKCVGKILHRVFQNAFSLAKEVRSSTEIGTHSVSMASASLRTVERIFPNFKDQSVLFIGAGEMITLFAQHYSQKGFGKKAFANRTRERAEELAVTFGGESIGLTEIQSSLPEFDIIVSGTASPVPILGKGTFEDSLRLRRRKPIVVFDLAVPRDVEANVARLDDIFLFTIDDLGEIVKEGLTIRRGAIEEADQIILAGVREFGNWIQSEESVNVVRTFRNFGDLITQREVEKSIRALQKNEDAQAVLINLANSLEKKFLDRPSRVINKANATKKKGLSQALMELFELDDEI